MVIILSQITVSQNSLTMAVNENFGIFFMLTKNNDWEITMSKNNELKAIINGQPLIS